MSILQDSHRDDEAQRRREILRRSRMGLFEDLDDLRDELADQLDDFESRLRRTALHLPRWLALPDDALRPSFELPTPEPLVGTLIGPRAIAVVAAEVEEFLLRWLGAPETDDGAIPAWRARDDEQTINELSQELDRLHDCITQALQSLTELADDGPLQLERVLESVVFELEERRELDVEALEVLIHDGDVDAGHSAQTEIAALWEEQRRRVGQLQRVWDDILDLHHEGISRTTAGLEELDELVTRARQGIEGAAILKANSLILETAPQEEVLQPLPEEQNTPIEHAGPTAPMITAVEDLAQQDLLETVPELKDEDKTLLATLPESESDPDPDPDPEPEPEPKTQVDLHLDARLAAEQKLQAEQAALQIQLKTEPEWEPDPTWEEDDEPKPELEQEVLRLRTFRIRHGWQEVTIGDMAATLGPPGLFIAIFFVWTLASLAGLADNPMLRFHWALPSTFAAMALWALLPLLLRWRPMWSGTNFSVIRRGEVEDEVDLRLTNQRLYFDRISWPLTEIQGFEFHRWEDREQSLCGWLLTIAPPYQKPLELSTLETNRRLWQESKVEHISPPNQAWQLPPEELDQIHEAIAKVLIQRPDI